MQVTVSWTAGHADALRQALRMTNESFANHLHVSARTVAYWRKQPDIIPQPGMQKSWTWRSIVLQIGQRLSLPCW